MKKIELLEEMDKITTEVDTAQEQQVEAAQQAMATEVNDVRLIPPFFFLGFPSLMPLLCE